MRNSDVGLQFIYGVFFVPFALGLLALVLALGLMLKSAYTDIGACHARSLDYALPRLTVSCLNAQTGELSRPDGTKIGIDLSRAPFGRLFRPHRWN